MATLRQLQSLLVEKIDAIRDRDRLISELEGELEAREGRIEQLQLELDKCRSILKHTNHLLVNNMAPEVAPPACRQVDGHRKRMAISGEPLGDPKAGSSTLAKTTKYPKRQR